MRNSEIHIRDPFVLFENGQYYMYGTRAANFGIMTGGFDVYISSDLMNWSKPIECFNSDKFHLNAGANWAPEVHKYKGEYYMFATFMQENGLRGTYILKADNPLGPFVPHSDGAITPNAWECLDGTLYISRDEKPYIIFCHEHTQIIDGTICFAQLNDSLSELVTEPTTIFAASSYPGISKLQESQHLVTDGPFLYRTKTDELLMIWSSFIKEQYVELVVKFADGEIGKNFVHLPPVIDNDGGHGMIFRDKDSLHFTFHSPNTPGFERPVFAEVVDNGDSISII